MTQECSYNEMFIKCMQSGKPLPVSWDEHTREKTLERLIQYNENSELLWIRENENIAVAAPPILMALVMGEYELAEKMLDSGEPLHIDDFVTKQCISETTTFTGSSTYTLFDIWFTDRNIPENLYIFILNQVVVPEINSFISYVVDALKYYQDKCLIEAIRRLHDTNIEMACYLVEEIIYGILNEVILKDSTNIWDELFTIFAGERDMLIQMVYGYFLDCIFYRRPARRDFGRMMGVLGVFLKYQDYLPLSGKVDEFVEFMIMDDDYMQGAKQNDLFRFMHEIPHFREEPSPQTAYNDDKISCIKRILEYGTKNLIQECFRNNFLKKELVENYIELALKSLSPIRRSYIVPRLLVIKWNMLNYKEDTSYGDFIQGEA